MSIQITGIPTNIKKPGFYGAYKTGRSGLGSFSQKLLLIGQRMSSGTVAQKVVQQAFSPADAATFWGAGSVMHRMFLAVAAQYPDVVPYGLALDDAAASAAATGTITLTGPATANGSLVVYVANNRVEAGVLIGDTATALATRLAATINAAISLPVTAAAVAGVVTMTAKNKGTVGNSIVLDAASSAAGITVAKTAMAAGATDPAIQDALDVVYPTQFHVIVPWDAGATVLGLVKTHLDAVSGPIEMRPGRAFAGITGSAKSVAAQVTLSNGINHERVSPVYLPGARKMPCEIGAAVGAEVAYQTDPARPFDGAVLNSVDAPDSALRLSRSEQEALLAAGISPLEVDASGVVTIVRLVTSRTSTNSSEDYTLLDTTSIASLDYFRQEVRAEVKIKFGRAKLNDKTLKDLAIAAYGVALRLEDLEILQNVADYKAGFRAERDPNTAGRAMMRVPAPIVPGLHQEFVEFELITL